MLERELKRKHLVSVYSGIRKNLRLQLKKASSLEAKLYISKKMQMLPLNSSPIRLRNRCWKTGKPRGFFRFFGLCRNAARELAHDRFLPGITKASW